MKKLYLKGFKHSRLIIILSLILFILSIYLTLNVKVNYDIYSFLPQELSSVKALEILNENFKMGEESYVVLPFKDPIEIERLRNQILKIEGIAKVSWISAFQDIYLPDYFWGSIKDQFIKDNYTFLTITFSESSQSPTSEKAVKEIQKLLPKGSYFTGTAVIGQDLKNISQEETIKYLLIGSAFVMIFLFFIFPSMYVPLIIYFNMILAIVINTALSTLLNQEISFISRIIVGIFQMGSTMDYALFLYHRYEEESKRKDRAEAGWEAVRTTAKSIIASAATTVAGFLAITQMRFELGKDLGFLLARGVFTSFILSLTLLPVLFYHFHNKWAYSKRWILRVSGERFFNFILKVRHIILVIFLIGAVSLFLIPKFPMDYNITRGLPENIPSIMGQRKMGEIFGRSSSLSLVGKETPENWQKVIKILKEKPQVSNVLSYYDMVDPLIPEYMVPKSVRDIFFKDGFSYASCDLNVDYSSEEAYKLIKELREGIEDHYDIKITGLPVLNLDLKDLTTTELNKVNLISIIAIFLIIALSFLSIPIPVLLVLVIELAITLNLAIDYITYGFIFFSSYLFIGCIQLGATIDYAVLLTSRYLEAKQKGLDKFSSAKFSFSGGINSILTSAGTMFFTALPLGIFSNIFMAKNLAMLVSRGAIISVISVSLFVLPLLTVSDPFLSKLGFIRKEGKKE